MLKDYLIALVTALIGLFIQIRPRLSNRYFGIDTWRHLSVADYIRKNKKYPKLMPEHYLINKPSDYPPFFRFLLALFPKKMLEKYQWFVSPLFDFAHNLFLFIVVYCFTGNFLISFFAQITYMLSPIVVMENSNLTTRSFASLLFSGSFFSLICYTTFGNYFYLLISVFLLTILLLSHRMSIQAIFFLLVIFSLIEYNFTYIAVLAASIIIAALISRGFYLKVLKGHLAMIRFWFMHIDNRYAHQIRGSLAKDQKNPDAVFRIYQLVQNIPFIAVFAANPFIIFVLAYLYFDKIKFYNLNTFGIPQMLFSKFVIWSILLFVIGVIVRQIKKLGCIGEGERYLEYSAFPIAIVTAVFIINGLTRGQWGIFLTFLIVAVFGALLPTLFIQQQVIVKDSKRSVNSDLRGIFDYINCIQGKVNIMTIPLYLADAATYFTSARLLTTDNSIAHIVDYSDFFPVLKKPLSEVFKRYDINYLFINQEYVKLSELSLPKNKIVKESGSYCLIKVLCK